jgi:hypothetical protein
LVAEHLRTLHASNKASARPGTALITPGSPFPLPVSYYGGLNLAILLIMAGPQLRFVHAARIQPNTFSISGRFRWLTM